MYAILETGGKQYSVKAGDLIKVEKLEGEPGQEVVLDKVLFIHNEDETKVGKPYVDGAAVKAVIAQQGKARKVIVFKRKRRKGFHKMRGHRQMFTALTITEIRA